MKVEIEIVGCGERRTGVSQKTGKPYDFVQVHFLYQDKHTEGLAAANCMISGEDFQKRMIWPGQKVEALLIYQNYKPVLYFV